MAEAHAAHYFCFD
jgi:FixJ family two-component response regulator